ncbi:hypothetical protein ACJJTC_001088 [Scirpophaga incertulas]
MDAVVAIVKPLPALCAVLVVNVSRRVRSRHGDSINGMVVPRRVRENAICNLAARDPRPATCGRLYANATVIYAGRVCAARMGRRRKRRRRSPTAQRPTAPRPTSSLKGRLIAKIDLVTNNETRRNKNRPSGKRIRET